MNPTQNNHAIYSEIVAALKEGHSFSLSGHQNPDGDVIGSQLALAGLIRRFGADKIIDIQNNGPVPRFLSYLHGTDGIKNVTKVDGEYDVQIVFECSGAERMGGIIDLKKQVKKVINLDHHLHNPNFGDINLVEPTTSSTCELIYKIFEHAGVTPSKEEAIAMYSGMVTDTGWFRYGNTNAQTHMIASKLLACGVPIADLSERIYLSKSPEAIRLLARTLTNMKLIYDNRVAVLTLPVDVVNSIGATSDDTEDLVNYGLQIESVMASMILKEKKDPPLVKVSLRSKGNVDINQVARLFGGGGHKNASGCALNMNLADAEAALTKEIARIFS
jgi:phosphoesterase RecJ-like protein